MHPHTETEVKASIPVFPEEAPTLYKLASDALASNENSTDAAEEYLFETLQSSPSLLRSLVRGAVKSAVNANVTTVITNQRRVIFDSVKAAEHGKARAKAHVAAVSSSLLDFPLSDGTRLRDATRVDVLASIDRYERVSSTMAHRARWLRALADIMPDGRRVGDVIDDARAKELYENAA